jgi:hypothetical protein
MREVMLVLLWQVLVQHKKSLQKLVDLVVKRPKDDSNWQSLEMAML